ncbi:hypothetical protein MA16_Dca023904 [Dendrobium catenatum]|uniref:Uncharacterized protein n=1 Tax=Dendrobium catenatum TaxID=906689 RepID=A0A2I0WYK0_9ASPA|nr:hypothetical protein MA16_Dca023904 [Dendrobium catenatum]
MVCHQENHHQITTYQPFRAIDPKRMERNISQEEEKQSEGCTTGIAPAAKTLAKCITSEQYC